MSGYLLIKLQHNSWDFVKKIIRQKPLSIFAKWFIFNVWQCFKYTYENNLKLSPQSVWIVLLYGFLFIIFYLHFQIVLLRSEIFNQMMWKCNLSKFDLWTMTADFVKFWNQNYNDQFLSMNDSCYYFFKVFLWNLV